MSATTAPAAAANALTGGISSDKGAAAASAAVKPRKRTTTSRSGSEATDTPLIATTPTAVTRTRRTRDLAPSKALGEATDLAFSRDLTVVDEGAVLETPRQKGIVESSERSSPVKHKVVKHAAAAVHRGTGGVHHKERTNNNKRSIWDVMGHLFSRLFLVFVVGVGLGTTAWSMRAKPPVVHRDVSASEIEKLEEFVTKTTKWMQVRGWNSSLLFWVGMG